MQIRHAPRGVFTATYSIFLRTMIILGHVNAVNLLFARVLNILTVLIDYLTSMRDFCRLLGLLSRGGVL